ncbi:MAG: TIGR01244 family sulfur transferase [Pseudomonadota bacterium]
MPDDVHAEAEDATPFRRLTEEFSVAPQITAEDVKRAAALGVTLIINNRPDGEEPGQPTGVEIRDAADAANIDYAAIPVDRSGLTIAHLKSFEAAIAGHDKALAYCRSGTRSATLWAFARVHAGEPVDDVMAVAVNAGYDLRASRPTLTALARANSQ